MMAVTINEINIENSGPITDCQLSLGPFNLIYGHNERGKTFLVEFLIRSLFKNRAGYSLRTAGGRGKVVLSGLSSKPLAFTPASRVKLEDHLAKDEPGMPAQISHLLVVKGAELNFDDRNRLGVDRSILKNFLAGQGVLDVIQAKIAVTVRKASFEDGQLLGDKRGEIKARNNAQRNMQTVDKLFEEIETIYSNGESSKLETEIAGLKQKIDEQELAKCHQAFLVNQEIGELQTSLDRLPEDEVERLTDDFKSYKRTQHNINRLKTGQAELEQKSEHYEWLEQAIPLYEQRGSQSKRKMSARYPILILFLLILALVFGFMGFPIGVALAVLGVIIAGWFFWRQAQAALDHTIDVDELSRLETEFKSRFGRSLSGLPLMLEEKKGMEEAYHGAKTQRRNLQEEEDELATLHDQIISLLEKLAGQTAAAEEWEDIISELLLDQKQFQRQLGQKKLEHADLAVEPAAYRSEPAAVAFDRHQLNTLQSERDELQDSLKAVEDAQNNLKQRICEQTADAISSSWETLIRKLRLKREEDVADYRHLTANVLAGIFVNKALTTIRNQEDRKIREKLSSPLVSAPIAQITNRYTAVHFSSGELYVDEPYGDFPISDLSTGTREQVLLGLRLGFAAQIFGRDRLFLILDDAFQHADWQRRARLVDQMVDLAHSGWQIIYLTMDDHIKSLFDEAGRQNFAETYRYYDLNEDALLPA